MMCGESWSTTRFRISLNWRTIIMLKIADIIEALCDTRPEWAVQEIAGGVVDSRQAYPGCLFVALAGESLDGHDFVGQAFEKGASLAVVARDPGNEFAKIDLREGKTAGLLEEVATPFCLIVQDSLAGLQEIARFWRRKLQVKVIGVTGSVGKSTTKELAAEVLSQRYKTLKNQGNLNNEIGLPLTLLSLDESHSRAVLEMGFYVPGEIEFLCEIAQPEIGVITNIGTVHAERAGSQDEIARGKGELIRSLPPGPQGIAILNYDDPRVKEMAGQTKAQVFFYGLNPKADLWADNVEGLGLDGIRFRLHYHKEVLYLRVPLIGRHSVHTALRATAVGLADGLTWQEIVNGLRSGRAQLRLITARTSNGALLLDDSYNASPESTLAALNLLGELQGRKIAVLGDMLELGRYERQGHEMVGVRAAQVADSLITVGEKAHMIAEAAREAGLPALSIVELDDVPQVIEQLREGLTAGDVVLVKGSHGMRMDRIVSALEARS
jgi:UDP-N-acetylmuramoyl-tripeptide--D-alanyl-D-alanine ligase